MSIRDIINEFFTNVENKYNNTDQNEVLIPYLNKSFKIPHRYISLDLGLILKVYEQKHQNEKEDIMKSVAEEIENLCGDTNLTKDIIQSLGKYYIKDFYKYGLKHVYALVSYNDTNFYYWECNDINNNVKVLKTYIKKYYNNFSEFKTNVIILSKNFFIDDSNITDNKNKILVNQKNFEILKNLFYLKLSKIDLNFLFISEDLDIDLLSRESQFRYLSKITDMPFDLDNILRNNNALYTTMCSDKIGENLKKLSNYYYLITKENSDQYFYINNKINGRIVYFLVWCMLKYNWQIVFEDSVVESHILRELHNLYVHNFDIITEQIKYLKTLIGEQVVITETNSFTKVISEAKIIGFKFRETVKALKVEDLMSNYDDRLKSRIIETVTINIDENNILFIGDVIEDILTRDKTEVEISFLEKQNYDFVNILLSFARILTYTVMREPINISDLVFIKINDDYYVSCIKDVILRIQVAMNCDRNEDNSVKIRTVPLDCIMPKNIYPIFRNNKVESVTNYYIAKNDNTVSMDILNILRLIIGDMGGTGESLNLEDTKKNNRYYKYLVYVRNNRSTAKIDYEKINQTDPEFIKHFYFTENGDFCGIYRNDDFKDPLKN